MLWVGVDVGLVVLALAVLTALAVRLFRQVRTVQRDVSASLTRLFAALEETERAMGAMQRGVRG